MALMSRPEDLSPDTPTETTNVVALEEDGGVEQENLEFSGLVAYVRERYERSKTRREPDEDRWLMAYRNYRGIYGPEVQFTDTEKSKAFIKLTKTKVLAAYAQVTDVLFAGSKFPIGIEASRNPEGAEKAIHFEAQEQMGPDGKTPLRPITARPELLDKAGPYKDKLEPVQDALQSGPGAVPTAATYEPAKKSAQLMEGLIHDQLEESDADKHLRSVAFECALFGTGILKGPFAYDKEYPRWNSEGEYEPTFKTIPKVESVSIWNLYPDPDARSMHDAEYIVQRHRMSRTQMRGLKHRPFFREESIELAIEYGADYTQQYWEEVLEDNNTQTDIERYEVLEYWGVIDQETAAAAELDIPDELKDNDEIHVNAWVCNGQILRLVMNPFTPTRIPYSAVPYELNPYGFFGIGVAENMEDTQLLMNGFMRMAVDNAALSGNLLVEVDETNLVPGQDMSIYPGKVFRRQSGAPGQAIFGTKFPNVSQELIMMFDKARQLADESTGMPSFAHGSTGVMGVGRTASGMSMLMGAAAQGIKSVVKNIDDYLLAPLGRALFAFNMQFNYDEKYQGDLDVVARGTESLMRNEIRSQRLIQFMQLSSNPAMAPFIKFDYVLREIAASMDLDEDYIMNDPREAMIQAKLMADMAALMPDTGAAPQQAPAQDPTGTGGGTIAPGNAPEPGAEGFTGGGGGANGGNPPPQQPQGNPVQ
ncbi:putative portal protein [Roseobacter phage CRP-212]|nr:putative portal protein [Roseobacter phage CRP-212]